LASRSSGVIDADDQSYLSNSRSIGLTLDCGTAKSSTSMTLLLAFVFFTSSSEPLPIWSDLAISILTSIAIRSVKNKPFHVFGIRIKYCDDCECYRLSAVTSTNLRETVYANELNVR